MKRIVCFGEALIDFLAQAPASPAAPRAFLQFAGGAPANVAVAAARLGATVDFVGMLGADMFGDFLLASLDQAGVGTGYVKRTAAANTALAFVALDAQGERSFSFYRPPAADLLFRAQHFHDACFTDAGILHLCSNSLTDGALAAVTLEAIERAQAAGALVSFDMNLRPSLWPAEVDPLARLWRVLEQADLVKLARNELDYLASAAGSEAAVIERLWQGRTRWLIVTDGARRLHWHTRTRRGGMDGFAVQAVDTTAAGDAFVGGLLAWLALRDIATAEFDAFLRTATTMDQALRQAAAAGAFAVTRPGAFAAMPAPADIAPFLEISA
ncbi:fructokinase [Tahibacter aquaticus]|uniref:Fructokinase n=1 Tax=Tahibacter aquaticus TaxID=520092 RepID=A0A4R6Z0L4_9GAMM|nr:carbohydrate kinase [Tahibacter aquaticus]TDR45058.1 fructokinase [Tahibacter aquaticus]